MKHDGVLLRSTNPMLSFIFIIFAALVPDSDDPSRPIPGGERSERRHPDEWVDSYGDLLYNYAFSRLRDPVAAEDAVQETFLAALKGRDSFAGESSERTWLVGILKHKVIDHLRKTFREQPADQTDRLPVDDMEVFTKSGEWAGHWIAGKWPKEWSDNPGELVEKKEFWEILYLCLEQLPARLSSVFAMREMEELETDIICKELGITATNLWVMLHRSRRQMRQCLESRWLGDAPPV
jgi:RNA polymerase sigma-70 factor (ECF subfamily)